MDIAMIGLGKMGANMTRRLLNGGHRVVVFDLSADAIKEAEEAGAVGADSLEDIANKLSAPRAAWIMVPAGGPTDKTIESLSAVFEKGDIIIDGGNSNYKESMRHAEELAEKGIHFVDVGTSGGIWGLKEGYSMMVGGEAEAVEQLRPALETLAPGPDLGWGHVGPAGSGHFTKMVHNGIEYGLMQAYAEGFDLLRRKEEFSLDLHQISAIWRHGSVVRSWLLDLTANALDENPSLDGITARVSDSGEGRWTVEESIELACAMPVVTAALQWRFRSRDEDRFADRMLSAMRNQFGGHAAMEKK